MLYFYDQNGRYIGRREQNVGEVIPSYATEIPVVLQENQEAFLRDGIWEINEMSPAPQEIAVPAPSLEEQVMALNDAINMLLGL